jgi:hypothetical protein
LLAVEAVGMAGVGIPVAEAVASTAGGGISVAADFVGAGITGVVSPAVMWSAASMAVATESPVTLASSSVGLGLSAARIP